MRIVRESRKLTLPVAGMALSASGFAVAAQGPEAGAASPLVEHIVVYGEPGQTKAATKLDLTLFETPQNVSVISRAQIEDFALYDVNQVMDYTPGVSVEEVETDRTYYSARGFDIVNFQYDGVGTPFSAGLYRGHQDTAVFEKVEVVKGAAGLITGLANPSATVNYVRKRPTRELEMYVRGSVNDWDGYRVEGDVAGPITERIRGRVVVATDDTDSYLDRYAEDVGVVYGVVEADLTETTLITLGHGYNESNSDGNLWGAIPLVYSDGTRTDYDVSTSTAPHWAQADITTNQTFVELRQGFGESWTFTAIYQFNDIKQDSRLFYVYGAPDPVTELGLAASSSRYRNHEEQSFLDLYLTGTFELFGQSHELVVGYNAADLENDAGSYYDPVNGYPVLGSDWARGNTPEPDFDTHDPFADATNIDQEQRSWYVSSRLNFTDRLSVLLGARNLEVDQDGFSYGGSSDTDADETVPYLGVTYLVTDSISLYGSYSETFIQQTWVNSDFQPLGPTEGENIEFGAKYSFNQGRGIVTLAYFETENHNLGEFDTRIDGVAVYNARDYDSDGYELEVSGEILSGLNVGAGFTNVNIENQEGEEARPFIPSELFKLSASYTLPMLPALKIGGVVKWQSETENTHGGTGVTIEQESYTLLDVMLSYDITRNLTASLNVGNVTDEKHLTSIYWDQGFYGPPRNYQASIQWRY